MEAEEEAISSGLPALEEQERRQSAPAELLLDASGITDSNPTANPSTPADPAAAASSGAGGASAGAPEQSALQVRDLPLLWWCKGTSLTISAASAARCWRARPMSLIWVACTGSLITSGVTVGLLRKLWPSLHAAAFL